MAQARVDHLEWDVVAVQHRPQPFTEYVWPQVETHLLCVLLHTRINKLLC